MLNTLRQEKAVSDFIFIEGFLSNLSELLQNFVLLWPEKFPFELVYQQSRDHASSIFYCLVAIPKVFYCPMLDQSEKIKSNNVFPTK